MWIQYASARGWVILTKDLNILKTPLGQSAVREHSAAVFALANQGLSGATMTALFLRSMPRMLRILAGTTRPFGARLTVAGDVDVVYPPEKVRRPQGRRRPP